MIDSMIENYYKQTPRAESINNLCTVKIKKLYPDAELPTRGSSYAAGWDLYAYLQNAEEIQIPPHSTKFIGTGLAFAIEDGWEGEIRPRSGLASKRGLRPANTPGTIDSDYRGEIIVAIHNDNDDARSIIHGERIAQILFNRVPNVAWKVVRDLNETTRGSGGFGSTGTN